MFVACVEFEIVLRHLDNFLVAMRKNAARSHAVEAGCQQFDVCQDQQNPNKIFLYEMYSAACRSRQWCIHHTAGKPVLWFAIDDQWHHDDPAERRDSTSLP